MGGKGRFVKAVHFETGKGKTEEALPAKDEGSTKKKGGLRLIK